MNLSDIIQVKHGSFIVANIMLGDSFLDATTKMDEVGGRFIASATSADTVRYEFNVEKETEVKGLSVELRNDYWNSHNIIEEINIECIYNQYPYIELARIREMQDKMLSSGEWCDDSGDETHIWKRNDNVKRLCLYNMMYVVDFSYKVTPHLGSDNELYEVKVYIDVCTPYLHEDTKYTLEKRVRLCSYNTWNNLVRQNEKSHNF